MFKYLTWKKYSIWGSGHNLLCFLRNLNYRLDSAKTFSPIEMLDRINGIVINCHVVILIFNYCIKVTENITQLRRDHMIHLYCNNHYAHKNIRNSRSKNVLRLELEGQSTAINYVIRYHTNITTTAHINFIQSYNLFPWDFVLRPSSQI